MIDSKVIEFLATSPRIEQLHLDGITPDILTDALSVEAPFPELKTLNIKIRQDAVASMVKIFSSVFVLLVTLKGQTTQGTEVRIRPLSELTQVRCLDIFVDGDMTIVPEDLISLRSLRNLRSLTLQRSGTRAPSLRAANFGDADFYRLVSGLPGLDTLSLEIFPNEVTSASLATLAKCCPRLQSCIHPGVFNMRDLRDYEAPLFPRLRFLRVACFMDPEIRDINDEDDDLERMVESRAYEHVQLLKKHFPNTHILSSNHGRLPGEAQFSRRVMRILRPHDS